MKQSKYNQWIQDILTMILFRMKLILKDTTTVMVLLVSVLLFSYMVHSLSVSAKVQSSIPIGIVDYDNSPLSKELIGNLIKAPTLHVLERDEQELEKLLKDEMINALFVIEDGYETKIRMGNIRNVITIYYLRDNKTASIISDILAGEMMYSICFYISYNYYERIPFEGSKHTQLEYIDYMDNLIEESNDFDFAFQMRYINPEKTFDTVEAISPSLLYNQLIIGILGILISFIAMFIVSTLVRDKEIGIDRRLSFTSYTTDKRELGTFGVILVCMSLLAIIFTSLILQQLNHRDSTLWISIFLLITINAMVVSGIFILISKLVRNIILFQLIGSFLILISGGLGFYHLLTGFYQSKVGQLTNFIPNSWFIQGITDIIVYGNYYGYTNEAHHRLFFMALFILAIIVIMNKLQEKNVFK